MEEQRTAVHFDGAGQQTAKVVDVPEVRTQHGESRDDICQRRKYKDVRVCPTCSVRAAAKRTLCLHRTFSSRGW